MTLKEVSPFYMTAYAIAHCHFPQQAVIEALLGDEKIYNLQARISSVIFTLV
jgi:hypothetical protein